MLPQEPHEISRLEGRCFLVARVVGFLVLGPGSLQFLLGLVVNGLVLASEVLSRGIERIAWPGWSDSECAAWMETVVGEERRHASGRVLGVVVGEFGERQDVEPVVLLMVTEDPEILFEDLVDAFRLAIRLRMKGR